MAAMNQIKIYRIGPNTEPLCAKEQQIAALIGSKVNQKIASPNPAKGPNKPFRIP